MQRSKFLILLTNKLALQLSRVASSLWNAVHKNKTCMDLRIFRYFFCFCFYVVCAKCITVVEWYLLFFLFFIQVLFQLLNAFFRSKSYVSLRFLVSNGWVKKREEEDCYLYTEAYKGNIFLLYRKFVPYEQFVFHFSFFLFIFSLLDSLRL